jgi:predicted MFS family arabinose efflux permease
MEISEPHERPILIGLMNTLNGSLAIAPPLGGLLAGWFGYEATFAVALLPIAVGLFLSFGLRLERRGMAPANA